MNVVKFYILFATSVASAVQVQPFLSSMKVRPRSPESNRDRDESELSRFLGSRRDESDAMLDDINFDKPFVREVGSDYSTLQREGLKSRLISDEFVSKRPSRDDIPVTADVMNFDGNIQSAGDDQRGLKAESTSMTFNGFTSAVKWATSWNVGRALNFVRGSNQQVRLALRYFGN